MLLFLTEYKVLGASNAMALTNLSTIITSLDVAKWIWKLTLLDLKINRENYILTHSNVWIVKKIIKPTPINALSSDTVLIENGIPRNIKSFMKTENN